MNEKPLRGLKEIANFLGYHHGSVQRLAKNSRLPIRKDGAGKWVMYPEEYRASLQEGEGGNPR